MEAVNIIGKHTSNKLKSPLKPHLTTYKVECIKLVKKMRDLHEGSLTGHLWQ